MWERIAIAIIIELIRRRLDKKGEKDLAKIEQLYHDPKNILKTLLGMNRNDEKYIGIFADIIEDILKKLD